jgi:hypothetical protein
MTTRPSETRISAYVMPSQCGRCCPVVTHTDYATNYAHETTCPNALKVTRACQALMEDGRGVVTHG